MSCTIGALPVLLIFGIVSALSSSGSQISYHSESSAEKESAENVLKSEVIESLRTSLKENNGEVTREMIDMICKEYQTVFMDKELLVKTLEEYGFDNFDCSDNNVSCEMESFTLEFSRQNTSEPYKLKVSCTTDCDEGSLVADLNSEYGLNTQEETYIKIKERLADKNLKIDEEEILDDDSIMLTINLD